MENNSNNQPLTQFILDQIRNSDGIPFRQFMQHCLYHPDYGYYMSARRRIGRYGDFYTSSSVHSLFGRLVARQIVQMWQIMGGGAFTVVEQGAGEGELAADILDYISAVEAQMYSNLRYIVVEISPDNRRRQQENLSAHGGVVDWCAFAELPRFSGCFLSNELLDAFAVDIVEKHAGELSQVYVTEKDGAFAEELRTPVAADIREHFATLGVEPVEGNRAEVCTAVRDWVEAVAAKLERGFVVTIDYGYPAQELYAPFRRHGTLLCYHRHQANDNPYQHIGCQDITSHVDFTAVQQFGAAAGLDSVYFAEQYRFLLALGFVEELLELQRHSNDEKEALAMRMTLKNLIMPEGGMGETFKVLIQSRGVKVPQLLCQRRLSEIPLEVFSG